MKYVVALGSKVIEEDWWNYIACSKKRNEKLVNVAFLNDSNYVIFYKSLLLKDKT